MVAQNYDNAPSLEVLRSRERLRPSQWRIHRLYEEANIKIPDLNGKTVTLKCCWQLVTDSTHAGELRPTSARVHVSYPHDAQLPSGPALAAFLNAADVRVLKRCPVLVLGEDDCVYEKGVPQAEGKRLQFTQPLEVF